MLSFLAVAFFNLSSMYLCKLSSINSIEIASLGLAITWINACSFALISTLNSGMLSQFSHAFGAEK